MPGSAPQRPDKRWPETMFAQLAAQLLARGLQPVLIGAEAERGVIAAIRRHVPEARDLCGQTSYFDIVALARGRRARSAMIPVRCI